MHMILHNVCECVFNVLIWIFVFVCVCVCLGGGGGVLFNTHIWMLLFWVVCGFYKECVLCLVTKKEEENKLEIEN